MRELSARFSLSQLVNLVTSALFVHAIHILLLVFLLLSTLVALLTHLVLKLQTYLISFCSCFVEQSLSDLRHVAHHVSPSPILNSPVSHLSTSLFLKMLKAHLFHCFFLLYSLYSPICYLGTDISTDIPLISLSFYISVCAISFYFNAANVNVNVLINSFIQNISTSTKKTALNLASPQRMWALPYQLCSLKRQSEIGNNAYIATRSTTKP